MRTASIKKLLKAANVDMSNLDISSRRIEVLPQGEYDDTDTLANDVIQACRSKYSLGGYKSGFNSWVLSESYSPAESYF